MTKRFLFTLVFLFFSLFFSSQVTAAEYPKETFSLAESCANLPGTSPACAVNGRRLIQVNSLDQNFKLSYAGVFLLLQASDVDRLGPQLDFLDRYAYYEQPNSLGQMMYSVRSLLSPDSPLRQKWQGYEGLVFTNPSHTAFNYLWDGEMETTEVIGIGAYRFEATQTNILDIIRQNKLDAQLAVAITYYGTGESPLPYDAGQVVDLKHNCLHCILKKSDLNSDGDVNIYDFSILIQYFNKSGARGFHASDINRDGIVNIVDFAFLISEFGT